MLTVDRKDHLVGVEICSERGKRQRQDNAEERDQRDDSAQTDSVSTGFIGLWPKELEALQQERPGNSSDYGPHMHNANRPDGEQLSSKSTIRRVLTGAAFAVLALSLLSVNTFPSINNDGVEYIGYSRSLIDGGLVRLGSRQIGYPLVLAIERFVAQFAGVEALLFSVLVQRLLLVVAVLYSVWLWRWRSTPVVLLAITPSFLAYTDLIMTESLTISLALLLACLVAHHFRSVEPTAKPTILMGRVLSARTLALISASAAAFIAFALLVVRYPFAVSVSSHLRSGSRPVGEATTRQCSSRLSSPTWCQPGYSQQCL